MSTVFWDDQGLLLVDFLPKGKTINSEAYIETLKKLQAKIRRARPQLKMKKIFLQHDSARPHTRIKKRSNHIYWVDNRTASSIFSRFSTFGLPSIWCNERRTKRQALRDDEEVKTTDKN